MTDHRCPFSAGELLALGAIAEARSHQPQAPAGARRLADLLLRACPATPFEDEGAESLSHDDIKAALESRSDPPWRPSHGGPVATRPSDTYDVYDCDGDVIAASLFYLYAHLIANAPTWLAELLAEVESLARWKTEALPVIAGLQELGAALGIRLGKRITGPDALGAVQALTERAEKAEQAIQRVRDMPATPPSGGYYMVSMRDVLRALDGGAS